eukprot:365067-Chlamydomonas_euryale.AAC.19
MRAGGGGEAFTPAVAGLGAGSANRDRGTPPCAAPADVDGALLSSCSFWANTTICGAGRPAGLPALAAAAAAQPCHAAPTACPPFGVVRTAVVAAAPESVKPTSARCGSEAAASIGVCNLGCVANPWHLTLDSSWHARPAAPGALSSPSAVWPNALPSRVATATLWPLPFDPLPFDLSPFDLLPFDPSPFDPLPFDPLPFDLSPLQPPLLSKPGPALVADALLLPLSSLPSTPAGRSCRPPRLLPLPLPAGSFPMALLLPWLPLPLEPMPAEPSCVMAGEPKGDGLRPG